ncbi:MAG: response regulator [Candidatus Korobacteraceae bacterium]|jgi:DNA-binding response OmpR family regulator
MNAKSGKKILVVDDEPDVVAYVERFLEDHGFDVISAGDGKQGFAKAKAELPDLIVLDIVMPKDTGVRMYRDLYEDAETRHIPVVMLTGVSHEFKRFISSRRQVPAPAGYFEKPADLNKMLERIEEILSSRPVQ